MTKTWLVTGGAGFIGSNLVHWALRQLPAVRIVVFDKLTYAGHLENLRGLTDPGRCEFVHGDIANPGEIRAAFARCSPDRVVNLAAETHVDRTIDGPRACVTTNLLGTFELLEAARLHFETLSGDRRADFRFLHVSTDEVYGSLDAGGRFDEETAYAPNSPYAASKAGADFLVRAYHRTYRLPTLTTNCSNNFGPRQHPEKLIPLMVLNAIEGRPLPIYGDGSNVRDWIYVDDHCRGISRALEAGMPGEQYAFGADNERSNREIVDLICEILERVWPARDNPALERQGIQRYADLECFVADRPGHDHRYAIDATKARRELQWVPETGFERALATTVAWYVENAEWRRSIESAGDVRGRQGLRAPEPGEATTDHGRADATP